MSGAVVGEIIARIVTGVWREKYGFPPVLISPGEVATFSTVQSEAASRLDVLP